MFMNFIFISCSPEAFLLHYMRVDDEKRRTTSQENEKMKKKSCNPHGESCNEKKYDGI